jgi:Ala-tRNA(Pro) deacylase
MSARKLKEYLDNHHIRYQSLPHPTTYTARQTAEAAHIPGKHIAKTVVLKVDGKLGLAVLPAIDQVHVNQLRHALGARRVELAQESEIKTAFPDCDLGAMPPFGNLYDMDVYVSPRLREDEDIAFNSGTHDELIQLTYRDFERLVSPHVLRF